jgi:predicted ABC-type ATPase
VLPRQLLEHLKKRAQFWVVAGPNGAGKSTLVRQYLRDRIPYINPDELVPDTGPGAALAAGRLAVALRREYLNQGISFAVETTLSGSNILRLIEKANASGYKTNLVYLGIETPILSISRILVRVDGGGHHVPSVDVVRRFHSSLSNLPQAMDLVQRVYLFDNSGETRRLLYSREGARIKVLVMRDVPEWARSMLQREDSRYLKADRGSNTEKRPQGSITRH